MELVRVTPKADDYALIYGDNFMTEISGQFMGEWDVMLELPEFDKINGRALGFFKLDAVGFPSGYMYYDELEFMPITGKRIETADDAVVMVTNILARLRSLQKQTAELTAQIEDLHFVMHDYLDKNK